MRKPLFTLIISLLGCLIVAGCGGNEATSSKASESAQEAKQDQDTTTETSETETPKPNGEKPEEEAAEEEIPRPARDLTPEQEMLFGSMSMWDYNYTNDFLNWETVLNTYEDGYFKGTENGTDFNGYFGDIEEIEPKIYKVAIEEINYKNGPEDADDPHGLQGVDSVTVYLPGTAWSALDQECALITSTDYFLSKATYNFCYHAADDPPDDMIFTLIYAEHTRADFASTFNGGDNCVYLRNRNVFPEIKSKEHSFFEKEAYDFRDANTDGSITISNICTIGNDDSEKMEGYERKDWEKLARECAGRVTDEKDISGLRIWLPEDEEPDHHDAYSVKPEYEYVNAQKAFAAWWSAGSGSEKMDYTARIVPYNDCVYTYAIGIDPGKVDDVTIEALDNFITSLTFTSIPEGLSNDSPDDEVRHILGTVGGHFKKGQKTALSIDIKEDNGKNIRYDIADGCGLYKDKDIDWSYDYYYGYETLADVAEGMKIDPSTVEEGEDYPYDITDEVYYIYLNKDDQIVFMYEKPEVPEETGQIDTSEDETIPEYFIYVKSPDGYANLRSGPGTEYDVICQIPTGDSMEVYRDTATDKKGNKWLKVAYWHPSDKTHGDGSDDSGVTETGWIAESQVE